MGAGSEMLEQAHEQPDQRGLRAAIDLYQQVLAAEPEHAEALWGMGLSLMNTGEFDEALESIVRASEPEPRNQLYLLDAGKHYTMLGMYEEARPFFEKHLAMGPTPERASRRRSNSPTTSRRGTHGAEPGRGGRLSRRPRESALCNMPRINFEPGGEHGASETDTTVLGSGRAAGREHHRALRRPRALRALPRHRGRRLRAADARRAGHAHRGGARRRASGSPVGPGSSPTPSSSSPLVAHHRHARSSPRTSGRR